MQKKVIASPLAPKGRRPLFAAIAAGTTLYVSGQLPIDAATGLMARGHRGADAAGAREHFGHSRRGGVCAVGCGEDHRPVAGHRGFRRDERRLRHLFHRRAAGARLLRGGASADGCARRDRRRGGQGLTSRGCPGGETPLCGPSFDGAARGDVSSAGGVRDGSSSVWRGCLFRFRREIRRFVSGVIPV